jgi:hypothetical protein
VGGNIGQASKRRDQAGGVGVASFDRPVLAEAERVGRADRERGVARAVGDRERGMLVGDRHVRPDEPAGRERARALLEQLGRERQSLVAPALEIASRESSLEHRRRAAVVNRPTDHAEPGHYLFLHFGTRPPFLRSASR